MGTPSLRSTLSMNTAGEGEALNPQAVSVQLNVGGTTFRTTLRTLMEGAQSGGVVFKCLCSEILGLGTSVTATDAVGIAGTWAQRVVRVSEAHDEYFVDADATPFEHWLSYLRTGVAPFVVAGPERERIIRVTEQAGLMRLAAEMRAQVDWRRADLQALLVRPGGVNLHGARLRGQDLSRLSFDECVLRHADFRKCDLSDSSFENAALMHADLTDSNLSRCSLRGADLRGAILTGAVMPAWDSRLLEGVKLAGALGWVPPARRDRVGRIVAEDGLQRMHMDMRHARLRGADLSGCDLSRFSHTHTEMRL